MSYDLDRPAEITVSGLNGGTVSGGEDGYNYPLAPKMIAFNVVPYDNDGETSVQKWIPALDGQYNAVATSNDAAETASTVTGSGALSIVSKTYAFSSDVDSVINGEFQYGAFVNGEIPGTTTLSVVNGFVEDSSNHFVVASTFNATTAGRLTLYGYGKNANGSVNFSDKITSFQGGSFGGTVTGPADSVVTGPTTNAIRQSRLTYILSNGESIYAENQQVNASQGMTSGILSIPSGQVVGFSIYSSDGNSTPQVTEDATNVYITKGAGHISIDKTTGTGSYVAGAAPAGTTPTTDASVVYTGFTTGNISKVTGDYTYSMDNGTGVGTANISFVPTVIIGNTTPTPITITNGVDVLGTTNVVFDENNISSVGSVSVGAFDITNVSNVSFALGTTNPVGIDMALGFGFTGGNYYSPTVDNDASGNATSGWDVGANGTFVNLQLVG